MKYRLTRAYLCGNSDSPHPQMHYLDPVLPWRIYKTSSHNSPNVPMESSWGWSLHPNCSNRPIGVTCITPTATHFSVTFKCSYSMDACQTKSTTIKEDDDRTTVAFCNTWPVCFLVQTMLIAAQTFAVPYLSLVVWIRVALWPCGGLCTIAFKGALSWDWTWHHLQVGWALSWDWTWHHLQVGWALTMLAKKERWCFCIKNALMIINLWW